MNLTNIELEVLVWHRATFPHATIEAIEDKFAEEFEEFSSAVQADDLAGIEDEFADMCIVFMSRQKKLGRKLLTQLITDKLEINKQRVWGPETENGDRVRVK